MIKDSQYPALYQSADAASKRLQRRYFQLLSLNLLCLLLAGVISAYPQPTAWWWILGGLLNLAALFATLYAIASRPQSKWYKTRAIAESIKTLSWRYALRVEPFNMSSSTDKELFVKRLQKVLGEHKDLAGELVEGAGGDQISEEMNRLRSLPIDARFDTYLRHRIEQQATWYSSKAKSNRIQLAIHVAVFLVLLVAATGLMFYRATRPSENMAYVDVLISFCLAAVAWSQAKRLPDLIASYTLAAHEISLIKATSTSFTDEAIFSRFVSDAENAFSREHTQWIARSDA